MSTEELSSQDHEPGNSFSIENFHQDPTLFERLNPRQQHAAFEMMRLGHLKTNSELVDVSDELLETQVKNEGLKQKVNFDRLTGLLSEEGLEQELEARPTDPICLLLVDVTNFKGPNDTYGKATGDAILKDVGTILRRSVRQDDLIARLNSAGDEFVIVAFDDDEESPTVPTAEPERRNDTSKRAEEVKEAMRARVEEYLEGAPELKVFNFDIAAGAASYDPTKPLRANLERADIALKQHKATQHEQGKYDRDTGGMIRPAA